MKSLVFSTGNSTKFLMGSTVCKQYDISLVQNDLEVDEVQSEDALYVAKRKAEAAFELLQKPVLISDDSWEITALNGFPGTYAKSVNTWFNADDYLRLMSGVKDRSIVLRKMLVYQTAATQKVFTQQLEGTVLTKASGTASPTATILEIVSFKSSATISVAKEFEKTNTHSEGRSLHVWHEFARWFSEQNV